MTSRLAPQPPAVDRGGIEDARPLDEGVFEGRDGYERFHDEGLIPKLFEISTDPARFHGRTTPVSLGGAIVIDFKMVGAGYERTARRARRDGVDHVWVQLITQGGLTGWSPGRGTAFGPGSGGVCDFSVVTSQVSLPSSGVALMLPRQAFEAVDPRVFHGAALTGARFDLLHDHVRWLCANAGRADPERAARTAATLAEVVTACVRPGSRPSEAAAVELGAAALRRAREFMTAQLARPDLTSLEIARAAGVSRSVLYRLAAPEGGVAAILWGLRLEAARTMLSDPAVQGRIGDVASACGFTSLQHFSRRFRERYGFAARNLRPF